jgi:iron-siderophore transport system substrate-binding protein
VKIKSVSGATAAVALAASLALAGCGSGAPAADPAPGTGYVTPRTMAPGKGSGRPDGVFPRVVEHFEGRTTIPAPPKRIAVISTGQADALLTLGVVPAGSTAGDGADLVPKYLYSAFPQDRTALDAVTYLGNRFAPDLETIANLKPDLILMNIAGKDARKLYDSLSRLAPTVATQGTGLHWKQDFLLLADALGKTGQARKWLDDYQSEAAAFGKTVPGKPTVSFLRRNGGQLRIFGVASFTGSVAEDIGLARPATQRFTDETSVDISSEKLDEADADWIFYGVQGGDTRQMTSLPLWPTLTGHAVAVDDDVYYLNVGPTAARDVLSQFEKTLR